MNKRLQGLTILVARHNLQWKYWRNEEATLRTNKYVQKNMDIALNDHKNNTKYENN